MSRGRCAAWSTISIRTRRCARESAALSNLGHPTDKIELLILGGTWSSYKRDYQEWFVQALLRRDERGHGRTRRRDWRAGGLAIGWTLSGPSLSTSGAAHRNVGLVIETRPDEITPDELRWLRHLGVTKVQMGAQSLDDRILAMNKRGHDVACTLRATALLRAAGFKIVLHWMPNLHGATPAIGPAGFCPAVDRDFARTRSRSIPTNCWRTQSCTTIWLRGEFHPYTTAQLIDLLADIKPGIPRYCRVNRVIRDIPSTNVVEGNRRTSLRQDVHAELRRRGQRCECVRCREVQGRRDRRGLAADGRPGLRGGSGRGAFHFLSSRRRTSWQVSCGCRCRNRRRPQPIWPTWTAPH